MDTKHKILRSAEFDPRLKRYFLFQTILICTLSIVGIPFLFFIVPFAHWRIKRYFDTLECVLTERNLKFNKGALFRSEKTIPLGKITDMTLNDGPVMRWLGICSLKVETAGGSVQMGQADARLFGLVNALEFREAVLDQRDYLEESGGSVKKSQSEETGDLNRTEALLTEIRDTLKRIEEKS